MQLNTTGEFQIHTSVFASSSLLLLAFMRAGFHAFSVSRSFTSSFRESVICITGLLPFALPCWLFLFATGCYTQEEALISSSFQSIHYHNIHLSKIYQQVNKATSCKCAECDYVWGMYVSQTSAAKCNMSSYCLKNVSCLKLMSIYLKSQCYLVQWDFILVKTSILECKTSYKGNLKKPDSFLDPLLYFDLQQLFHSTSIIKITNVSSRRHCSYFSAEDKLTKQIIKEAL